MNRAMDEYEQNKADYFSHHFKKQLTELSEKDGEQVHVKTEENSLKVALAEPLEEKSAENSLSLQIDSEMTNPVSQKNDQEAE